MTQIYIIRKRIRNFVLYVKKLNIVSILFVSVLIYLASFENRPLPSNIIIMMKWAAGIVAVYEIYRAYSEAIGGNQNFSLPTIMLNTNNIIKLREKHYIIDDSLPVNLLQHLLFASKILPRIEDDTYFPGQKIFFKMTPLQDKQLLEQLVSIDPIFEKYTTNGSCKPYIGIIKRSTVVAKRIKPNPHTDQDTDALGLLTYLNVVGGGTAMFKHKGNKEFPLSHPFSFEVQDIPSNPCWKMVERFDNKSNRTIIFPINQLHSYFFDLNTWPENVPERLTFNYFLQPKTL